MKKKPVKKNRIRASAIKSEGQFLVVQPMLKNGPRTIFYEEHDGQFLVVQPRTIFYEEHDAYIEAHALLAGARVYPKKLLIVKVIGAVKAITVTKKVKP